MEGGDLYNYLLNKQIDAIKTASESISAFQYALPEDEARHVFGQVWKFIPILIHFTFKCFSSCCYFFFFLGC